MSEPPLHAFRFRTFAPDPSFQKFSFIPFVRQFFCLVTFVSELVCQNVLLVVLDASTLFQNFHFVTANPGAVQLLDKVFGILVADFLVRNLWIATSVSELMADAFRFENSGSSKLNASICRNF